jgi:tetratricopeptide (TPR) repeat protein
MFVKATCPITKLISVLLAHSMLVWIVSDLWYTGSLYAQTTASDYLNKGIEYCENFEFDEAITNLNKALGMEKVLKEDKIKIHLYLAFCLAAKSEMDMAKSHFLEILKIDPNFTLSYTESAIFLDLFEKAKEEFKRMNPVIPRQAEEQGGKTIITEKSLQDSIPPRIMHVPLDSIEAGKELSVFATISDNEGIAVASLLFIREDQKYYRSVPMNIRQDHMYEAKITSDWIQPPNISYFIHAVDEAGNEGFWKSKDNPFHLSVYFNADEQFSTIRDSVRPIEATTGKKGGRTILWVGLGALVVSGGILAVVLRGGSNGESSTSILTDPPPWPN